MKKSLIVVFLFLLLTQSAFAQEEEKPNIWFLAHGHGWAIEITMVGVLDALQTYGFINPADRGDEEVRFFISPGDSAVDFNVGRSGFELDRLRAIVADALDDEADILITLSAPATLSALQATEDWDDPPVILFANVYNPYEAGIADAPCVKPANVTGSVSTNDYAELVSLAKLQFPDLKTVGTIHSSNEASGIYGAGQIAEAAAALGLTVEEAAVTSLADLSAATEGLLSKGVEALILPLDASVTAGMPLIATIAGESGVPMFSANFDSIHFGAIVGAGFFQFYDQGLNVGTIAAAYLRGELDIASAGISAITGGSIVGLSLGYAESLDLAISQELFDHADVAASIVDDLWHYDVRSEEMMKEQARAFFGDQTPMDERMEIDLAFLASLECTAERIAEQQAELDAMEG
jgi:ABC-type uncharacterized transport system substrate-binding protein